MPDFVTLSCPSCGAKLEITADLERFACAYCGQEQVVRRSGGIVSLKPVVDGLEKIQVGTDKTASELAIKRLKEETSELRAEIREITEAKDLFGAHYRRCRESFLSQPSYEDIIGKMGSSGKVVLVLSGVVLYGVPIDMDAYEEQGQLLVALVRRLRDKQRQLQHHEQIVGS